MQNNSDSLLISLIRPFFKVFGSIFGFGLGITLTVVLISLIVGKSEDQLEVKAHYSPTIVPNAKDQRKLLSKTAPIILKININGFIGTDKLNMHTISEQLVESREGIFKDGRVKAVLLHISSPGGTVDDSDGIYQAVKEYKENYNVPVFAFVDGLAASGGIYIACAADKIFTTEASIVGSVGVLSPYFFNFTKLMEKIGVESKTLIAGKGKDDLNPFRPWKEGEEDSFNKVVQAFYDQFVDAVVKARPKINKDKLVNEYGAQIFPARAAFEYGFTDGSGYNLSETLKLLAKEVDIEDDFYQVVKMEKKISLSDLLKGDSTMMTGTVKHKIELAPQFDVNLMNKFLYLYLPN